jgi:hypothetical protein
MAEPLFHIELNYDKSKDHIAKLAECVKTYYDTIEVECIDGKKFFFSGCELKFACDEILAHGYNWHKYKTLIAKNR